MTLDYVASGCTFARMMNKRKTFQDIMVKALQEINGRHEHSVSMLFNALMEENQGDIFQVYRDSSKLYSDSGGLQLGIYGPERFGDLTKAKDKVYNVQSKYSDYAFIFDELPIENDTSGDGDGNTTKVDLSTRCFTPDTLKDDADRTAKNVKRQIEIFKKNQSNTKIFLIAHGNCAGIAGNDYVDYYSQYIERIVDDLTPEETDYIYGVAPSSAANGTGSIDRFDMIYSIKNYNIPDHIKKHIHLLGVGSPKALLPFKLSSEYFSFIDKLSFDSTSHTRKYAFNGEISVDGIGKTTLPKFLSVDDALPYFKRFYEKFEHLFKMADINSCRELVENCTHYSPENLASEKPQWEFGRDIEKYKIGQSLIPSLTTMDFIDIFFREYDELVDMAEAKGLKEVKTWEDYIRFRKHLIAGLSLSGNRVATKKTIIDAYGNELVKENHEALKAERERLDAIKNTKTKSLNIDGEEVEEFKKSQELIDAEEAQKKKPKKNNSQSFDDW